MATYSTLEKKRKTQQQKISVKIGQEKKKDQEALCLNSATANFTPTATIFTTSFKVFVGVLFCMAVWFVGVV